MEKQQNFTDLEYTNRRRTTKREAFLEKMDATLPWKDWVALVVPYYPSLHIQNSRRSFYILIVMQIQDFPR